MAFDELYKNISRQNFKALGTLFLKPISRQRPHSNNQRTHSSQTTADVKPRNLLPVDFSPSGRDTDC